MQVRAIATAAAQLKKEGLDPQPEIMIPLVSVVPELAKLREVAEADHRRGGRRGGRRARHPRWAP